MRIFKNSKSVAGQRPGTSFTGDPNMLSEPDIKINGSESNLVSHENSVNESQHLSAK